MTSCMRRRIASCRTCLSSQGARAQPLFLVISTAGFDRHSILWELYAHAKKVQENPALDPSFLPILYEAPEGADWTMRKSVAQVRIRRSGIFGVLEEMQIAARGRRRSRRKRTRFGGCI